MTPSEAELWSTPSTYVQPSSPCHDCTWEFHLAMRSKGLCDGTPQDNGRPRFPGNERLRQQWREAKRRQRERAA